MDLESLAGSLMKRTYARSFKETDDLFTCLTLTFSRRGWKACIRGGSFTHFGKGTTAIMAIAECLRDVKAKKQKYKEFA